MDTQGKFVVFDGGEGSGKSHMSKVAVIHVESLGLPVLWTREPGGSPYAEKIRELILCDEAKHADAETMLGLFWAARRDHLVHTVLPALGKGVHVICDRFDSSTWAYQIHGQERAQLIELFKQMRKHYLQDIPEPHYIILDVPPQVGLPRAKSRGGKMTHFDEREAAFHERVRRGLLDFAHTVIDATQPLGAVEAEVRLAIERIIKN